MSGAVEKLQTINSFFRTVLALFVVGGLSAGGWYGYTTYNAAEIEGQRKDQAIQEAEQALRNKEQELLASHERISSQQQLLVQKDVELAGKDAEITDLNAEVAKQLVEIERLDTAMRLHKMQRRLARLDVLDVVKDTETGEVYTEIEFVELNELGDPIGEARQFRIDGDMVYVDYWVVKFEDKYVELADMERGVSICMFHRIFGELQKPKDGFHLDEPGTRPGAYARGSVMSDLERNIWNDFWGIANDPAKAEKMGIRTLHGDAVSIKVTNGKTYKITIRAAAGPEIEVDEGPAEGDAATNRAWSRQEVDRSDRPHIGALEPRRDF
jgi:hypothetical protein